MTPRPNPGKEAGENDVRYGIAECRKRLRTQRTTLRVQHQPPTDVPSGEEAIKTSRSVESYAEIFATVSMSQGSLSRLVECLLDPVERRDSEQVTGHEEALLT
jgi:hypothetical protein